MRAENSDLARSASARYGKSRASKRVFIDEPFDLLDAGAQMSHARHLDTGCLGAERTELRWIQPVRKLTANGFHYFTLNAGTAPPFSMNVHLPSAHTRFSISIRFNWTYCSGDSPIACR